MSRVVDVRVHGWLMKKKPGKSSKFEERFFTLEGPSYDMQLAWFKNDADSKPQKTPLKMGQLLAINNTSKSDALNQRISDQCVDLVFEKKTYTLKATDHCKKSADFVTLLRSIHPYAGEGWLIKKNASDTSRTWTERYFRLNGLSLTWYDDPPDAKGNWGKSCKAPLDLSTQYIRTKSVDPTLASGDSYCIDLVGPKKAYVLRATHASGSAKFLKLLRSLPIASADTIKEKGKDSTKALVHRGVCLLDSNAVDFVLSTWPKSTLIGGAKELAPQGRKLSSASRAAEESDSESILSGWEAFSDDDGEMYYHNSATGATQWDKPTKRKAQSSGLERKESIRRAAAASAERRASEEKAAAVG